MRKTTLLIAASASLLALANVAVPAFAGSATPADTAPTAASQSAPDALNLDAIPVKEVTGPLSVRGVGDGEDDDAPRLATGSRSNEHDGAAGEEEGEYDD